MYQIVISLLEYLKHSRRSKFKIIRAFNHFKYILIVKLENKIVKYYPTKKLTLNYQKREKNIIVSLTSFPGRINECFFSLKSIFAQSVKPDKIILWLAESQFPDHKLPSNINILISKGLEVRFCEDLRSHKKYYYILQEQKTNELVITVDDDIIYHPDTIKRALSKHYEYPQAIVCNEAKIIKLDSSSRSLASYNTWKSASNGKKQPEIYKYSILTGSGCLYPYGIMPRETFDKQKIKNIAFTADDLWITFIAKLHKIDVVPTDYVAKPYTTIDCSQKTHLAQVNCIGSGNNDTIMRFFDTYPNLKEELIEALS